MKLGQVVVVEVGLHWVPNSKKNKGSDADMIVKECQGMPMNEKVC